MVINSISSNLFDFALGNQISHQNKIQIIEKQGGWLIKKTKKAYFYKPPPLFLRILCALRVVVATL